MFTNILVPLDGSALSETALPYARALAQRTGARLTLIRAAMHASLFGETAPAQQRSVDEAEQYLSGLATALSRDGFAVEIGVPFGGHPAKWIIEESDIRKADLILMASHDRVGVDRWLHGSVAESVIHTAKAPVVLVKGSVATDAAARFASEKPIIVVPLDGSELAEAALPLAIRFATALNGRIVLVSAVSLQARMAVAYQEALVSYTEADYAQMEADARDYLQKILGELKARGIEAEGVVRSGDAALEIASIAQQYTAAAVVMATHGRTGAARSVLGSVAGAVVHSGTTPVILIRPDRSQLAYATQEVQSLQVSVAS